MAAVTDPTKPIPFMPPPPGQTSNFVNPPNIAWRLHITAAVCIFLATIFLIVRLVTKLFILRKRGLDDVTIVLAYLFCLATNIDYFATSKYGFGKQPWNIQFTPQLDNLLIAQTISTATFSLSIMFSKITILLFYLCIWPQQGFRYWVYATMAAVVGYSIALCLVQIFPCVPWLASFHWAQRATAKCVRIDHVYYVNGGLNVGTDLAMILLPTIMLKGLQLPVRNKIAVGLLFSLGSFTMVAGIIRLAIFPSLYKRPDFVTFGVVDAGIWAIIEVNFGVVCAATSVTRQFVRHLAPQVLPFSYGSSRGTRRSSHSTWQDAKYSTKRKESTNGSDSVMIRDGDDMNADLEMARYGVSTAGTHSSTYHADANAPDLAGPPIHADVENERVMVPPPDPQVPMFSNGPMNTMKVPRTEGR